MSKCELSSVPILIDGKGKRYAFFLKRLENIYYLISIAITSNKFTIRAFYRTDLLTKIEITIKFLKF